MSTCLLDLGVGGHVEGYPEHGGLDLQPVAIGQEEVYAVPAQPALALQPSSRRRDAWQCALLQKVLDLPAWHSACEKLPDDCTLQQLSLLGLTCLPWLG